MECVACHGVVHEQFHVDNKWVFHGLVKVRCRILQVHSLVNVNNFVVRVSAFKKFLV